VKFLFQESSNPHYNFCPNFCWSYTTVIQILKIHNKWKGNGNHHCKGGSHSAHSPVLAPSDFHLFLHVKKRLASQTFHEDEDVKKQSHYVAVRAGGGVMWYWNIKTRIQSKQMPWKKVAIMLKNSERYVLQVFFHSVLLVNI
jgi:hypothetical protein